MTCNLIKKAAYRRLRKYSASCGCTYQVKSVRGRKQIKVRPGGLADASVRYHRHHMAPGDPSAPQTTTRGTTDKTFRSSRLSSSRPRPSRRPVRPSTSIRQRQQLRRRSNSRFFAVIRFKERSLGPIPSQLLFSISPGRRGEISLS